MTAIAGFLGLSGAMRAAAMCRRMIKAQLRYGPHGNGVVEAGDIAMGRALYRLLPGEDAEPWAEAGGPLLLAADVRIDNRDELLDALGLDRASAGGDSWLLHAGWSLWGEGLLERLNGDFAFAVWESERQRLTLVRDPSGQRPLHYVADSRFAAFATMPSGLLALPGVSARPDEARLACFLADLPAEPERSFFDGVRRVEPGALVRIEGGEASAVRWWSPPLATLRLPRIEDYAEALGYELDRAVSARLRRASGGVAAHLSGGWDSSAVAASAALALACRGERLAAFTSAPREGFNGPIPEGYVADESLLAAATAALHPNVDHNVLRPAGGDPFALAARMSALAQQPTGHVCNNLWWTGVAGAAAGRGASVLLTGEMGNHTISAGSAATLADWLRRSPGGWYREARGLVASGDLAWRSVLASSFGPFLPAWVSEALRRAAGRGREAADDAPYLAPGRKDAVVARRRSLGWDGRGARDTRLRRLELIRLSDPGNFRKAALAGWGIDERDPTADRRLIEFCLSLPPEALLAGGVRRPALRRVLEGRVAGEVLDSRLRGYQTADWYERIGPEEVSRAAQGAAASADPALFATAAMTRDAARWPTSGWERRDVIFRYRMQLLRAISAAQFAAPLPPAPDAR